MQKELHFFPLKDTGSDQRVHRRTATKNNIRCLACDFFSTVILMAGHLTLNKTCIVIGTATEPE